LTDSLASHLCGDPQLE